VELERRRRIARWILVGGIVVSAVTYALGTIEGWDDVTDLAGWLGVFAAIPWLWYFALDRLRELSAAIQGKRG
jgi:hypothetical protein